MKRVMVVLFAAALWIVFVRAGEAAPRTGFGVDVGVASHIMDGTFKQGGNVSYSSLGLSLGIDYQIAVSEKFSINPFLMTSSEQGNGDVSGSVGHGIFGLEGRYWFDSIFIGAHVASYSEVLSGSNNDSTSANGTGFGLSAGWEDDHGGLFVMAQLDKTKLAYSDADVNMTGVRMSVGYRW